MTGIPRAAFWLGVAGLLPFAFGVVLTLLPANDGSGGEIFAVPRDTGALLLERYGMVILAFMGGCLWGFACYPRRRLGPGFWVLFATTLPALWAFFAPLYFGPTPQWSCALLAAGFLALLAIDLWAHNEEIAPPWWLALRLPLTLAVVFALLFGAFS
ncbi:DUF3429 domain-containing protein [Oceanomicrobium pacificus]|uniref:DUF3429 family protein n=1 Tax=Oceanomicrobium pacificus TaxID=2692916 RepID=A0A6B0TN18_9RHOB|nr:DUF3429 domain-containing protein [Oceanomicrobium pacificus]MXU63969.1 DUF3429 family protein [Oceanomicrobium pacificus]